MRRYRRLIGYYLLLNSLWSCAISSPKQYWNKTIDFRTYAEEVFRRQNQISSEILMLTDEDVVNPDLYAKLLQAEQNLQDQCQLLNEYAIRERDGVEIPLLFQQEVQSSVDDCELAMQKADVLLNQTLLGEN